MERKEAIEVIKKNWPDSSFTMLREALETVIPELAESEDERIRKSIIAIINNYVDNSNTFKPKMIAWLEKQGEQKLAWSEEDENHVKSILSTIECCKAQFPNAQAVVEAYNADIEWLKSLKDRVQPQSQWKPSDEQIRVVNRLRHCFLSDVSGNDIVILDALLEQLKKL